MAEFVFTGTVELHGVVFTVIADDEKQAIEKARAGEYENYDTSGAETVNWEINHHTVMLNE